MTKCLTNIMDGTEEGNGAKMYMEMIDSKITYTYKISYQQRNFDMFKHVLYAVKISITKIHTVIYSTTIYF